MKRSSAQRRPAVVVADGVRYAEGLRWHDQRLWFSDMLAGSVLSCGLDGVVTVASAEVAEPSGIGFLPDGRALVVSRRTDALVMLSGSTPPAPFADLAAAGVIRANDMVTDDRGVSYVGALGKVYEVGDEGRSWGDDAPGTIACVNASGAVRIVARGLACGNGMAITPDRRSLIVAETYTGRLLAYERHDDDGLGARRTVAVLDGESPDGITLDEAGHIWVGLGHGGGRGSASFVRFSPGGEVVDRIETGDWWAIGCTLGGPERRTLFLAVCRTTLADMVAGRSESRILAVDVDVPGAGWP